jgi:CDP-diacylglycerol---serine O-phosphatidyltransferase
VVCILTAAASTGAVGDNLWFGKVLLAGYALHPFALIFALSGSLMISRIHIPKL